MTDWLLVNGEQVVFLEVFDCTAFVEKNGVPVGPEPVFPYDAAGRSGGNAVDLTSGDDTVTFFDGRRPNVLEIADEAKAAGRSG